MKSEHIASLLYLFSFCRNKNWKMYRVRVGTTTRNKGGQVVEVADVQIHPQYYKKAPYDYDVSVITVAQPLKIDNITVKKITLVKPKTAFEAGTEVTLLGWGYTDVSSIPSTVIFAPSTDIAAHLLIAYCCPVPSRSSKRRYRSISIR